MMITCQTKCPAGTLRVQTIRT